MKFEARLKCHNFFDVIFMNKILLRLLLHSFALLVGGPGVFHMTAVCVTTSPKDACFVCACIPCRQSLPNLAFFL